MKTITLFSDLYYNSGVSTRTLGRADSRWAHHSGSNEIIGPAISNSRYAMSPGTESDTFRYILNSIGLDCDYTNDRTNQDIVRMIDIGSNPDWLGLARDAREYFRYKPFILYSSQEPCVDTHNICNKVPGCFIMDMAYGTPEHERHIPYPSFFTRLTNNFMNEIVNYHTINLKHTKEKDFTFNNLKFRQDGHKALTQFFLTECDDLMDKGIITYSRSKGHLSPHVTPEKAMDLIRVHWDTAVKKNKHVIEPYVGAARFNKDNFLSLEKYNHFLYYSNDVTLNNFALNYEGDQYFNHRRRYHPIWVYNRSFFSMITESTGSDKTVCISEKSIYPIMTGHPFIINQCNQGLIYKSLSELGFELFDELFTYPDNLTCHSDALINCAENIYNFDAANYDKNINTIVKKSAHNRSNLLNTRSTLWTTLRKLMLENLEKYYQACSEG